MTDDTDQDIDAAREFARRFTKGLPSDRLYDGDHGAKRVARGIIKLAVIIADYEAMERQRGEDAMRIHKADSKFPRES